MLFVFLDMQTSELKKKIVHQLEFADQRMLKLIHALLEADVAPQVYEFSQDELALLEEAEDEIRAGEVVSNEQVEKQIAVWLSSHK